MVLLAGPVLGDVGLRSSSCLVQFLILFTLHVAVSSSPRPGVDARNRVGGWIGSQGGWMIHESQGDGGPLGDVRSPQVGSEVPEAGEGTELVTVCC